MSSKKNTILKQLYISADEDKIIKSFKRTYGISFVGLVRLMLLQPAEYARMHAVVLKAMEKDRDRDLAAALDAAEFGEDA
jgi:hypothetical protein